MQEFFFLALLIIFIVLVVSILLLLIVGSRRRSEIEQNKTPLHTQTSGGRIGWVRYRGPFVRLSIYDEFVVIRYGWKTIVLPYGEIERVETGKWLGMRTDSVQIVHHKPDAPPYIRIGAFSPERIKELIESKLVPID
jgi:hypothetical protein